MQEKEKYNYYFTIKLNKTNKIVAKIRLEKETDGDNYTNYNLTVVSGNLPDTLDLSIIEEVAINLSTGIANENEIDDSNYNSFTIKNISNKVKHRIVNNVAVAQLDLTVHPQAYAQLVSSANSNPVEEDFAYLMRLLQGQKVKCDVFSPTNISGSITSEQLKEVFKNRDKKEFRYEKTYEKELFSKVFDKFVIRGVGFQMNSKELPKEIEAMCNDEEYIKEKKSNTIGKNKKNKMKI